MEDDDVVAERKKVFSTEPATDNVLIRDLCKKYKE
jgi:hypothetical protein